MPINADAVGKSYPPSSYAVGREKIREYAAAVGETNPLHHDLDAARAAGHPDLVAPPMFAAVYSRSAMIHPLLDPEVGIDFGRMVHGAQEFTWDRLVVAGDEIATTATVLSIEERGGLGFFAIETHSADAQGARVCRGLWTHVVRGEQR
ncbi:MAG TPA: MaoC family dehydratase N-terminal domain-containing protein [Conexibacter sp.]|nr:MaoC family dehydratase N-terminal domain-containing protein [Conexibacter sp.]